MLPSLHYSDRYKYIAVYGDSYEDIRDNGTSGEWGCDTLAEAKKRAKYMLTEDYKNSNEMGRIPLYSQVLKMDRKKNQPEDVIFEAWSEEADELEAMAHKLNAVIHSQNLYRSTERGTERFCNAMREGYNVTVESIQTEKRVVFVNDGSFHNCNRTPVIIEIAKKKQKAAR